MDDNQTFYLVNEKPKYKTYQVKENPNILKYNVSENEANKSANQLLAEALKPVCEGDQASNWTKDVSQQHFFQKLTSG